MREKYESLSAVVLRDLAKARGLKNISGMKKSDLVDLMVAEDERQGREENTKRVSRRRSVSRYRSVSRRSSGRRVTERDKRGEGREHRADETISNLDSGIMANGILEVRPDGYGLSAVRIIFRVSMMCMFHHHRSESLI